MFFKKKKEPAPDYISEDIVKEYAKTGSTFIHPTLKVRNVRTLDGGYLTVKREALWMNKRFDTEYGWERKIVIDKEGFIEAYKTWILPLIESGELK